MDGPDGGPLRVGVGAVGADLVFEVLAADEILQGALCDSLVGHGEDVLGLGSRRWIDG
jgi:hypothetical protein